MKFGFDNCSQSLFAAGKINRCSYEISAYFDGVKFDSEFFKTNKIFSIIAFAVLTVNCAITAQTSKMPTGFAEGAIDTAAAEYNPTFTPDGKTVYFTRCKTGCDEPTFCRQT